MDLRSVLKRCEDAGHPMSKAGLYIAGKKNGFIARKEDSDKNTYVLIEDKFVNWLDNAVKEVPEGWLSVKETSEKFNIGIGKLYVILKYNESCCFQKFGAGAGVTYVNPEAIERIIKKGENYHINKE